MLSVKRIQPHILGDVVGAKDKKQNGDGDGINASEGGSREDTYD